MVTSVYDTWTGGYNRGLISDPRNWTFERVPNGVYEIALLSTGSMVDSAAASPCGDLSVGQQQVWTPTPYLALDDASINTNFLANQNIRLTYGIAGSCHVNQQSPYSGADTVVVSGAVSSHLYLQTVMTFGSYTETGGTMISNGVTFAGTNVLLNCDLDNAGYQVGMFSGGRMEINGTVRHGLEIILSGTQNKATELYVDKTSAFHGVLAFDGNAFADFKDLKGITSYRILHGDFVNHTASEAIQLFRGRSVVATEYIASGGDQNLKVATGQAGTFIYDAPAAQMAQFQLHKL